MKELDLKLNMVFGAGSTDSLAMFQNKNVTIVTDPIMKKLGKTDAIEDVLRTCSVTVFDKILPDPTLSQVSDCFSYCTAKRSDVIVAFGGGSAIDTVKAVMLVYKNAGMEKPFFAAIPTTSGTGSEVTNYTVVTDESVGRKIPIADDIMIPDLAILDYTYTKSVPASVTAFTGMDVITHAMEAYVAKNANPLTDAYAEKALKMAFKALPEAFKDGDNDAARENMQMASYMAGIAFTKAGLGICHSLAHAIGAAFHIPHGLANSICLPSVVAYNASMDVPFGTDKSETAARYAEISHIIGLPGAGVRLSVQYLIKDLEKLQGMMNLPKTLAQAGVTQSDYNEKKQFIINSALADMCTTVNPKEIDSVAFGKLLDKIYKG